MTRNLRRALLPILIIIILVFAVESQLHSSKTSDYTYSGPAPSFVNDLQSSRVKSVVINTTAQTHPGHAE